jgi:hypothetical protein
MSGRLARVASVSGAGWPYSLPAPDEITAMDGWVAASSAGVVDEVEP